MLGTGLVGSGRAGAVGGRLCPRVMGTAALVTRSKGRGGHHPLPWGLPSKGCPSQPRPCARESIH